MASNTALNNKLRARFVAKLMKLFADEGEEVMQIGSNDFCFPIVDDEGNDKWLEVVVKVPSGWTDDDDGYAKAEQYRISVAGKAEKAAEAAKKKAEKRKRDEAERAAKKAKKEKGE